MNAKLRAVLAFMACCASSSSAAVISGPTVDPANGHVYYLLSANTWSASEAEAQSLGGNLATVRNAAENTWLFNTFSAGQRNLWIGFNDSDFDNNFTWADGEPVTYTNWDTALNQPNLGPERWVFIARGNLGNGENATKWHDIIDSPTPLYPWVGPVYGVVERSVPATQFVISPAESSITLSGTALGTTIQEQLPGSLTTQLQGTLFADLSVANQLTLFAGGHVAPVPQSGPFIPGNTPAQFGDAATLSGQPAYGAYRDLDFSQSATSVMPIDGQGNFSATGLSFSTLAGRLDYIAQGSTSSLNLTGATTVNQASLQGTVQPYGNGYKLTIPIHFTIDSLFVSQTFDGQIVAYSSSVPEPGTWSMTAVALLGLVGFIVGQRRR
ncbi:MAG TPA: lectin-like protein [Pirellulales bacterium]|nr:lectin-like protein [Pirellulales bacterium]